MSIRPIGDKVIVTFETGETKTAGGLHIPETAQKAPNKGTVIAVGPGKALKDGTYVPPPVAVGDVVLYDKYGAVGIDRHGEKCVVVDVKSLIGVYE